MLFVIYVYLCSCVSEFIRAKQMFLFRREQNEQKRYEKRKNEKNRTDLSRKKMPVDFLGIRIIPTKIQRTIESREEKRPTKKWNSKRNKHEINIMIFDFGFSASAAEIL